MIIGQLRIIDQRYHNIKTYFHFSLLTKVVILLQFGPSSHQCNPIKIQSIVTLGVHAHKQRFIVNKLEIKIILSAQTSVTLAAEWRTLFIKLMKACATTSTQQQAEHLYLCLCIVMLDSFTKLPRQNKGITMLCR